MQEHP